MKNVPIIILWLEQFWLGSYIPKPHLIRSSMVYFFSQSPWTLFKSSRRIIFLLRITKISLISFSQIIHLVLGFLIKPRMSHSILYVQITQTVEERI